MNPRRFLALALRLVQSDKSPEGCRTAVSRAYYAAYHAAAAFLEQCGLIASRGPSAHGDVRHTLGFSKDSDLEEAGLTLRALHAARILADYHLSDSSAQEPPTAAAFVNQASEVIRAIDECSRSAIRRESARDAIKRWVDSRMPPTSP